MANIVFDPFFVDLLIKQSSCNKFDIDGCLKTDIDEMAHNFILRTVHVKDKHPKEFYKLIHQLFKNHDNQYYQKKIKIFQAQAICDFNNFDNFDAVPNSLQYSIFIEAFNRNLVSEIYFVYHRWRCFPNERLAIYQKYPNHAYVKLIKLIHQHFLKTNNPITIESLFKLIYESSSSLSYLSLLLEAIKTRSELFTESYYLYLNTSRTGIKPKYKLKHNYYPFQIFSFHLFLIEHLFDTS